MFGYTAEEVIGQPILLLIPEELHYEEGRLRRRPVSRSNCTESGRRYRAVTGFCSTHCCIRAVALHDGYRLTAEDVDRWSILLRTWDYREAMLKSLWCGMPPEIEPLPPFAWKLLAAQK
jgi:hypothetical protein